MRRLTYILGILCLVACSQPVAVQTETTENNWYRPEVDLGQLFIDIQMSQIFPDSKTFVDCTPIKQPSKIVEEYNVLKDSEDFDMLTFVKANFRIPEENSTEQTLDNDPDLGTHLMKHWDFLTRNNDSISYPSTLFALPKDYVVPGGRFREIYYWDSYFTMLGLMASERDDLAINMVDNFAYLIDEIGFIPNGNRTYYLGRSQPPFFSSMVMLLGEKSGVDSIVKYLPQLEREYDFWMDGVNSVGIGNPINHVVMMEDSVILNRYWDKFDTPRPESYREDVELAEHAEDKNLLYRNVRAAAASGWDFSTRWFKDPEKFESIITTEIIPVDLNCLLYQTELAISQLAAQKGDKAKSDAFKQKAAVRKDAILKYCWNPKEGYFTDYIFTESKFSPYITAAGNFPLYYGLATQGQADSQAIIMQQNLLSPGGLVTTKFDSEQQWDSPNGWAPLQWIAIKGFEKYGSTDLSYQIADRWLGVNEKVYANTGKMMEKYNVMDTTLLAGGGEYPTQDGFGWTNGVALAIIKDLQIPEMDTTLILK